MAANEAVSLSFDVDIKALEREITNSTNITAKQVRAMFGELKAEYKRLTKAQRDENKAAKKEILQNARAAKTAAKAVAEAEARILAIQRSRMSEMDRFRAAQQDRLQVLDDLKARGADDAQLARLRSALEKDIADKVAARAAAEKRAAGEAIAAIAQQAKLENERAAAARERARAQLSGIGTGDSSEIERATKAYLDQLVVISRLEKESGDAAAADAARQRLRADHARKVAAIEEKQAAQAARAAREREKAAERVAQANLKVQRRMEQLGLATATVGREERKVIAAIQREKQALDALEAAGADAAKVEQLRVRVLKDLGEAQLRAADIDKRAAELMRKGSSEMQAYARANFAAQKSGKAFRNVAADIAQQMPDVITQLQSGTSAAQVFTQQGLQVVQINMHYIMHLFDKFRPAMLGVSAVLVSAGAAYMAYANAADEAAKSTDSVEYAIDRAQKTAKRYKDSLREAARGLKEIRKQNMEYNFDLLVMDGKITQSAADRASAIEESEARTASAVQKAREDQLKKIDELEAAEKKLAKERERSPSVREVATVVATTIVSGGDLEAINEQTQKAAEVAARRIAALEKEAQAKRDAVEKAGQFIETIREEGKESVRLINAVYNRKEAIDEETGSRKDAIAASKDMSKALEIERKISEHMGSLERSRLADTRAYTQAREAMVSMLEQQYQREMDAAIEADKGIISNLEDQRQIMRRHEEAMAEVREKFAVPVQQNPLLQSEQNATKKLEELYRKRLELVTGGAAEERQVREQMAKDIAALEAEYAHRRQVVHLSESRNLSEHLDGLTKMTEAELSRRIGLATRHDMTIEEKADLSRRRVEGIAALRAERLVDERRDEMRNLQAIEARRLAQAGDNQQRQTEILAEMREARAVVEQEYRDREVLAEAETARRLADINRQEVEDKRRQMLEAHTMALGALADTATNLETVMDETRTKSKSAALAFFAFQKSIAVAQAIVSGVQAVQATLALGAPLGPPLAAVMKVATAANVAAILATKPSGGGGGGGGRTGSGAASRSRASRGGESRKPASPFVAPPAPPAIGFSAPQRAAPAMHNGGMVTMGAPAANERYIRAQEGEAVLSREGVRSVGGPEAVEAHNGKRSAPSGYRPVIVDRYQHRVFDDMFRDNARLPGSHARRGYASGTLVGRKIRR